MSVEIGLRRRRLALVTLCGVLIGTVAGCKSPPLAQPGPVMAVALPVLNQQDFTPDAPSTYALRAGDVLNIAVFREPDLSPGTVRIAADGMVSVPMIGSVHAAGWSASELESHLERVLGERYLRHPEVSVNVAEYGSHLVTVEGSVRQPGVYAFSPGARLSSSLALARGSDRVANLREVAIFRQGADGMEVAKFDFVAVREGTMIDPVLVPGDRVVVGFSALSQAWQDLLTTIPLFALFTRF